MISACTLAENWSLGTLFICFSHEHLALLIRQSDAFN